MQGPGYSLRVTGGHRRAARGGTIVFEGNPEDLQQLLQPPRSCLEVVLMAAAQLPSVLGEIHPGAAAAAEEAMQAAAIAAGQTAAAPAPALDPLGAAVGATAAD
jgi:hypothetical protein